ncbi:MAG: TonB-dependent receptor plug domain-containing protein [Saprospiraceae bacterium]|nr:TonB-dependent receptor plug domain-containing protein [Saprospiraceae bacterium]
MRYLRLLLPLLLAMLIFLPSKLAAQKPLVEILEQIEDTYDVKFSYSSELVAGHVLAMPLRRWTVKKWRRYITRKTSLQFKEVAPGEFIIASADPIVPEGMRLRIVDSATGEGLPYATVSIKHAHRGAESNEDGEVRLTTAVPQDTLQFNMLGYQPMELTMMELKALNYEVRLIELSHELEQILIARDAILPISYDQTRGYFEVQPDQLNLQNGWGEPDLLRTLQGLPGVLGFDESASRLSVRGGTPDQNLITVDGIPVYKFGHFFGMITALNPYIMDDVKVYKGGFGAEYGARSSSVIDISNSSDSITEFSGGVGFNLLSLHAHFAFPFLKKRGSFQMSARSSVTDNLQTNSYRNIFENIFQYGKIADYRDIEEQDLLNENRAMFEYGDLNMRLSYRFKEDDEFSLTLYNSLDAFQYEFEIDQSFLTHQTSDDVDSRNTGVNFSLSNRWLPWWQTKLSIVASEYQTGILSSFTGDLSDPFHIRASMGNTMDNQNVLLTNHLQLNSNQTLNVGLQNNRYQIRFNTLFEQVWEEEDQNFDVELSNDVITAFADYDIDIADKIFISAGVRLNRINQVRQNIWEPRFSVLFRPRPESPWAAKLKTGSYKQFVSTLILEEDDSGLNLGNDLWVTTTLTDDVPVLATDDISVGFSVQDKGWLVDIEGYFKHTVGLSILNLGIDRPDDQQFSPGEASARGIELLVQKKWRAYRSMFSYTFSKVEYLFPELNDGRSFTPSQDRRHVMHWTHLYRLDKLEFILGFHLLSGRPFTEPIGILKRTRPADGETYYLLDNSQRNRRRLGTYHRADVSVQYQWIRPKWQLKTGVTIYNAYDQANPMDRRYFVAFPEENSPELASVSEISLRRTINFFVRVEF